MIMTNIAVLDDPVDKVSDKLKRLEESDEGKHIRYREKESDIVHFHDLEKVGDDKQRQQRQTEADAAKDSTKAVGNGNALCIRGNLECFRNQWHENEICTKQGCRDSS